MQLSVQAYRCQMQIYSHQENIVEKENYCILKNPENKDWFWGTFMIMNEAPFAGDRQSWEKTWDDELPEYNHRSFGWNRMDGVDGEISQFTNAGYERFDSVTLICKEIIISNPIIAGLKIKKIESENEWKSVIDLQTIVDEEKYKGGRNNYKLKQLAQYRSLTNQGKGQWWGAYLNDTLVGDMGLYQCGEERTMLQFVETHPLHRKKGICTALTQIVVEDAIKNQNFRGVVVVAQAGHPAEKLYHQLGFELVEKTVEICLAPLR